jgi:hypothetical protein
MNTVAFDAIPLWLILAITVVVILLAIEIGFRAGIDRARKSENERQAPIDPMVGSTLGLLAFVLAFTFGMATSRYDARKQLVVDDAIAIRTADLRAQQLPEPDRSEIRALLREYVDVRLEGALTQSKLPQALARTEQLQDQLWARAVPLGQRDPPIAAAGPLMQALVQMIELHAKRVTGGIHNRIPGTIWIALYCMTALAMAITGYRAGISGRRSMVATLTMVLAFSAVIVLIADLDRPQQGFVKVSQQAMLDLQTRLRSH